MDFNDVFILECFADPVDKELFNTYNIPSLKDFNLSARWQFLKKEEYIIEDPNDTSNLILSVKGKDFLEQLQNPQPLMSARVVVIDLSKTPDNEFEEWWKAFPASTAWTSDDGNTKFIGSRALRNLRKADAKKRYLKLLNQGLIHDELLGSLKYEIKLKKVDSIKKNTNQMEYFKGMEAYLNSERYLLYVENYRDNPGFITGTGIQSKKQNVTDI